ncbi:MAG: hypothetical protein LLF92_00695 [Planctomycetaceae bacterium]|nr:hypothetical protein [Planctomycetaceae bacterium]
MAQPSANMKMPAWVLTIFAGVLAWWIPGAGHWLIGERKRAVIIFVSLMFAFTVGLFIGSMGVLEKPWFYAQILFSPIVAYLEHLSSSVLHLDSFGRPREIGEIYTGIAGMMNLLCIVNAMYLAHCKVNK